MLVQEIQKRIATDPKLTEQLVHVLNHELAPSEVFTPTLAFASLYRALLTKKGHRRTLMREARKLAVNNWRRRAPSHPSPAAKRKRRAPRSHQPR